MPAKKNASLKNPELYEELREDAISIDDHDLLIRHHHDGIGRAVIEGRPAAIAPIVVVAPAMVIIGSPGLWTAVAVSLALVVVG